MPSSSQKLLEHILMRRGDANVPFGELRMLLRNLGFNERIKGDHHIFTRDGIADIINIQPMGRLAKAYQVRQIRKTILDYNLSLES